MDGQNKRSESVNSADPKTIRNNNFTNNLADVDTYFKFLDSDPNARFTCAFFDNQTNKPVSAPLATMHLSLSEILAAIPTIPTAHLHTTLNETNLKGRRNTDIQGVRVLCVDMDSFLSGEEIRNIRDTFKPHLIVKSSYDPVNSSDNDTDTTTKCRYHLYWKLKPPFPKDSWRIFQKGLAYKLKGDIHLDTLAHTIRVPGIARILKNSCTYFVPEIVYLDPDATVLDIATATSLFPFVISACDSANARIKQDKSKFYKKIKNSNGTPPKVHVGERNNTLFSMCLDFKYKHSECSEESLLAHALDLNEVFTEPLQLEEVTRTSASAFNYTSDYEDGGGEGAESSSGNKDKGPVSAEKFFKFLNSSAMGFYRNICGDNIPTHEQYEAALASVTHFHERSLLDRAIERYSSPQSPKLIRTTMSDELFAFNEERCEWKRQTLKSSYVVQGYANAVARDFVCEPMFIAQYCKKMKAEAVRLSVDTATSYYKVSQTVRGILSDPRISIKDYEIFDSNPYLFKCSNGVIDLSATDISLREPRCEDYLLASSEVSYIPDATCPNWEIFLSEIFSENTDLIPFMQELFGYSLTGLINEQKIFVHKGVGANGKSKVLEVLRKLTGEYHTVLASDELGVSKRIKQFAPKNLERIGAKIQGKRTVILDDLATSIIIDEGLVKTFTYPKIRARAEYEVSRTVPNRAKLHVGANTDPIPESENEGLIRRMCLIPYERCFTHDADKSDELDRLHDNELSGVLNWAIVGLKRKLKRGKLDYPESTEISLADYRREYFVTEETIKNLFAVIPEDEPEGEWLLPSEACDMLNRELVTNGELEMNLIKFGRELKRAFPEVMRKDIWNKEKKFSENRIYLKVLKSVISI